MGTRVGGGTARKMYKENRAEVRKATPVSGRKETTVVLTRSQPFLETSISRQAVRGQAVMATAVTFTKGRQKVIYGSRLTSET